MSVLVKGMEMPKTCGECRFSVDGWCYAIASNDDQPGYIKPYEKAKWCPLIEIPPHGRLIDADELIDKQKEDAEIFMGSTNYGDKVRYDEAMNAVANIVNAPTVIPADKDGET